MGRVKIITIALFISVAVFVAPPSTLAEGFADFYLGPSFSKTQTDVTDFVGNTVKLDDSTTIGYRMGYWFNSAPSVGIGLEISTFEPDLQNLADLRVIPITPMLMFRFPINRGSEFPFGDWQPYLAAGPGFFYTDLNGYDNREFYIGLDAKVGIKKLFTYNFGMFIEGRYTSFKPDFNPLVEEFELDTFHVLFGLSVHF